MKGKQVLFVCLLSFISSVHAAHDILSPIHPTEDLVATSDEEVADLDIPADEQIKSLNDASTESTVLKPSFKSVKKKHHNDTEPLVENLKAILANITEPHDKATDVHTDDAEVETTTPYDVKHYLTAEQKYYMLRINLLGIGIHVAHEIIPIPVDNKEQYKEAMEALLDKVQAAREASANITAGKMQNITLEDAHKLQMKMAHSGDTSSAAASKTSPPISHTTGLMVLGGVAVAIIIIGAMIYGCKRAMDSKGDYYDHLQGGGGGSVPLN